MQSIEESPVSIIQKVRLMMRLKHRLKVTGRYLSDTAAQTANTDDRTASAALRRMRHNTEMLEEDVREAASRILRPTS